MRPIQSLRQNQGFLGAGLLLVFCAFATYGADTYDPLSKQLSIPSVTVGSVSYTNMVLTVSGIVSGPVGTFPYGSHDTYDPATNTLTVPSVLVGSTHYFNVVVTVTALTSIGSVSGADSFDGTTLTIPAVQVLGATTYKNVGITVESIIGVAGGMPAATQDIYNPASRGLSIPAVQYAGKVYTNVSVTVGSVLSFSARFGHVVLVVEESANYTDVVGSASMPYLNSLAATYGLATQYYANTHPSIGNYEMLATGQVLTNNNGETPASFPITADSVVSELSAAGKTWKAYAENMPMAGYIGGNDGQDFLINHVPLAYLASVQNNTEVRQADLQPYTSFATDLAAGQLPNFSFVTPNACDDAQVCSLSTADTWLQDNLPALLTSTPFKDDGLLIVLFEESGSSDNTNGGGRVAALMISPAFSKPGYQSSTLFQHQSTLRLILEGLGVHALPGAAASAPAMWEFFSFP